ncbi:MAG: hypothetical protein J0L91_07560, partial [Burkholderiales bacterium]|nr:hypothetical protein [Burkholderiales bacterium]
MTRNATIAAIAFLTLVDLFATQAILPTLARAYGVAPAAMGVAVNASAFGMAIAGLAVALFGRRAPAPDVFALAYMAFVVAAFVPLLAAVRHQTEAERGRLTLAETLASLR